MKIAILSDIHANIFAFEAVLKLINDEDVEKIIDILKPINLYSFSF